MIRFGIALLVLASLLAGMTWMAHVQLWIEHLPSFFYQTSVFLVFSTTVIFVYLYKIDKPAFFTQLYLLTMVVKLIAYGAYVLIMILEDKEGAMMNVVFFMILYFAFTALEIAFLYGKITCQNRPE